MLSLVLLLVPHVAPPAVIQPREVVVADGNVHITLLTPDDMKWPEDKAVISGWGGQALEEAARPLLTGKGVRLEWVEHELKTSAVIEFVGQCKGPLPGRLHLNYYANGPAMRGPHGVDVTLSGVKLTKGNAEKLAALQREAALGRLVSAEVKSGGLSYFAFARKALAAEWKVPEPEGRW